MRAATLTDEGMNKIEKWQHKNLYEPNAIHLVRHLEQALKAHALLN